MDTFYAHAKINRFLRIVRQEADGYHYLQTAFQFLNIYDRISFEAKSSGGVELHYHYHNFIPEEDLIYRAIKQLENATNRTFHLNVYLDKRLPIGGGIGGGSSNAATTLVALNQLYQLNLSKEELLRMGLQLGADVPIFIHGAAAWAEGRGEQFRPITLKEEDFWLIVPNISISTATIFSSPSLMRDNPLLPYSATPSYQMNDCESAIFHHYPEMEKLINELKALNQKPFITGTGSSILIPRSEDAKNPPPQLEMMGRDNNLEIIGVRSLNETRYHD